jgi:hypothetical protein
VSAECYERDPRVRSIMIDVNCGLYMDETTGEKLGSFGETTRMVGETVRQIAVG